MRIRATRATAAAAAWRNLARPRLSSERQARYSKCGQARRARKSLTPAGGQDDARQPSQLGALMTAKLLVVYKATALAFALALAFARGSCCCCWFIGNVLKLTKIFMLL